MCVHWFCNIYRVRVGIFSFPTFLEKLAACILAPCTWKRRKLRAQVVPEEGRCATPPWALGSQDGGGKKMVQWQKVEPTAWKPESEGDSIEGVLVSKQEAGVNIGARYFVQDASDNVRFLWGSAILDQRMEHIHVGDVARIEFDGKTTNKKGQTLHKWNVYRGRPEPKSMRKALPPPAVAKEQRSDKAEQSSETANEAA